MILFNITCHIENNIERQFTKWITEDFLLRIKSNAFVFNAHFFRLLTEIDDQAKSFSFQIIFESMPNYNQFQLEFEDRFVAELQDKFHNKIFTFTTLLEEYK